MDETKKYSHWNKRWENDNTPWHLNCVNPLLEKYINHLLNGRTDVQILFPLCGKSVDMMMFYRGGHRVVGVEFCKKAIDSFFKEQGLDYKVEKMKSSDGMVYQTLDERLKIFNTDFFKFNRDCAGLMDAVWDRGSFSAIKKELRIKYVENVTSLLAPTFRYILIGPKYRDWFYSEAPYTLSEDLIQYLFAKNYDITLLHKRFRSDDMIKTLVNQDVIEEFIWLLKEKELAI